MSVHIPVEEDVCYYILYQLGKIVFVFC